ncbi:MAG: hypothetical protein NTV34_16945 [Proteobacteria bacterium]|nr:hypothetical protein [Pseudomonadota bacterium]
MSDNTDSPPSSKPASEAFNVSNVIEGAVKTLFESTKAATMAAVENSKDKIEMGQDLISDGVSKSVSLIKKHPIESAVVGFALGCIVGNLLRRRD